MDKKEFEFQNWIKNTPWYGQYIETYGEPPDLDTKDYNYREAYKDGINPAINESDGLYHWPSKDSKGNWLKGEKHKTRWKEHFMEKFGYDPDSRGITQKDWERMK